MPSMRQKVIDKFGMEKAQWWIHYMMRNFYEKPTSVNPASFPSIPFDDGVAWMVVASKSVVVLGQPAYIRAGEIVEDRARAILLRDAGIDIRAIECVESESKRGPGRPRKNPVSDGSVGTG